MRAEWLDSKRWPAFLPKRVPDIIKLDISLIRHIDAHAARRSLVASMVAFGRQTSADVVAEGIETKQELDTLRELGVRYGQGFLLGRPSAVSSVVHEN